MEIDHWTLDNHLTFNTSKSIGRELQPRTPLQPLRLNAKHLNRVNINTLHWVPTVIRSLLTPQNTSMLKSETDTEDFMQKIL